MGEVMEEGVRGNRLGEAVIVGGHAWRIVAFSTVAFLIAFGITLQVVLVFKASGIEAKIHEQSAAALKLYSGAEYTQRCKLPDLEAGRRTVCLFDAREDFRQARRQVRDLEAQQIATLWTKIMGQVALVGMTVGVASLALILMTFRETRRTADAGFDANEISRMSNEAQLRAYVGIIDFRVSRLLAGEHPLFEARYCNTGQTPARDVQCRAYLKYSSNAPNKVRFEKMTPTIASKWDVFPGVDGWISVRTSGPINDNDIHLLKSSATTFVFAGYIMYRDVFGKRHFTIFRHFLLPDSIEENGLAKVGGDISGNRSN